LQPYLPETAGPYLYKTAIVYVIPET